MPSNLRYVMLLIAVGVAIVMPTPSARTMPIVLASLATLYLFTVMVAKYRRAKHSH